MPVAGCLLFCGLAVGWRRASHSCTERLHQRARLRGRGGGFGYVTCTIGYIYLSNVHPGQADNFAPEYLKVNPNGTVPSLTSPTLSAPISDSVDILRYLDSLRGNNRLVPENADTRAAGQRIIDLVHSSQVDTNIIFFNARSVDELDAKKGSFHKQFLDARQQRLEQEHQADPAHPFYGPKMKENGQVQSKYQSSTGHSDEDFFTKSHELHRQFAAGMETLESLLVLPFAAGDAISEADFHVIPWLSHAMVAANSDPENIQDFSAMEKELQKSASGFKVGPRTRQWWATVAREPSFQQVFPHLH